MVRILAENASNFDLEAIENGKSALVLACATARIAIFGLSEEKYRNLWQHSRFDRQSLDF
jgi:hypothetical protein